MTTAPVTGRIARPELARAIADALAAGSVLLVAGPGYGKTMALEQALELAERRSVWVPAGAAGGEPGRLLTAVVDGLSAELPGLTDVAGERFAAGLEPVDVTAAAGVLRAELERLLAEPLAIVFDDAEELENAPAALALIEQLMAVRGAPLSVAVATRRPLALRLAKLRASGGLAELGPADLAFTANECEELLRQRLGRSVGDDEVAAAVAASEGWPMGVALTGLTRSGAVAGAVPREELFDYLAEEVLDRLDPRTRADVIDSSVPDTLTPELVRILGLSAGFLDETERAGLFLRAHSSGEHSYHPLFRAFLRRRLHDLRTEQQRSSLHARAAAGLAAVDRHAEAIAHWLEAGEPERALVSLSAEGADLVRTSPGTVGSWLAQFPPALRARPETLFIEAQLLWGAGDHDRAQGPLRAAIEGHRAAGDPDREWLARVLLADTLIFTGGFSELLPLAERWEEVTSPIAAIAAAAVASYAVVALASLGRVHEAETLIARLRAHAAVAAQFSFLYELSRGGLDLAAGRVDSALARFHGAAVDLELSDPHGRLPYALGMTLSTLRNLGERQAALRWADRCEEESERVGLGWAQRDFRLQRASLLAQTGDLPRAEVELARARIRGDTGWRALFESEAEAHVASLRGDAPAAVAAARVALDAAARAPWPWRAFATVELAGVLSDAGEPAEAARAIEASLAALDEMLPGERGRFHRASFLAARAMVEYRTGAEEAARRSMSVAWAQADDEAARLVRAHWPALRPVLWDALAAREIDAQAVIPAMQDALPGGAALVEMIDHPDSAVRRAALLATLAAGHPALLGSLAELSRDTDKQVAAAAAAARERLRSRPPPLRFEMLGGFRVKRAGWELDESAWQRPMAARIARFLLIQDGGVPEDVLFEAFWDDRPADAARQHLNVAVSRARKVLDLPGAEQSVIEVKERTYRLRLRERDSVDFTQFEDAAAAALADRGRGRRAALERAAALWTGEPLPEDRYAAWSTAWRERLCERYSQVLGALIDDYDASGDYHDAILTARRLLELDPLDERAHRRLMVAYARTGRTSQALRQYLECRRALVVEAGSEPAAETSRLQARILAGEQV